MIHHPLSNFTSDWVTTRLKEWDAHFADLAGKPIRILEIGSYEGRSACWFVHNLMEHPKSELFCVDPWTGPEGQNRLRRFDMNIALTGSSEKVRRICAKFMPIHHTIPGEFDLIYIDGDHVAKEVISQAAVCWPRLKAGGLMLFDDYRWTNEDVKIPPGPGIDAFLNLWQNDLTVIHHDYQVLVQKNGGDKKPVATV